MVKKIIQKLTIIFALIFVFIPNNTYALQFPDGWVAEWATQSPRYRIQTTGSGWGSWTLASTNNIPNLPNHVYRVQVANSDGSTIATYPNRIIAIGMSARNCTFTGVSYGDNSWFRFIGQDVSSAGARGDSGDNVFNATYYFYSSKNNSGSTNSYVDFYPDIFCTSDNTSTWFKVNSYVQFSSNAVKDYTSALNAINSNIGNFRTDFNNQINDVKTNYLDVIIEKMDDQTDQQEQEKQESQQQGEQSQTNSNQAGGDVQQNTTSILNAITGFFSAFTSAQPTNCNMDWGLDEYGFGVINMCQNPIPSEFQVVLSIVSLLFIVPMILWLFNSIINAFKEFQS